MRRVSVVVRGRVQGVGFRYSARSEAQRLGVTGWIGHRADGSVEAEIQGPDAAIDTLLDWLAIGPPGASVSAVDTAEVPVRGEAGFRVEHG
ncbi:MAG: acylphosphatase [Leifsonia sp.]